MKKLWIKLWKKYGKNWGKKVTPTWEVQKYKN